MRNTYGSFTDSMMNLRNVNDTAMLWGLEADVPLLPTTGVRSGSKAFCVDTGAVYIFLEYNGQWYKQ